jgi:N-acetylmuramoyl-L-alanine amidase
VRSAPTRPAQLWPFTRFRGTDYVSVRDIGRRFGLKPAWTKPQATMTLADAGGARFLFDVNQRDFYLDGARIFLSDPVLSDHDSLWVGKADVIKVLVPLFRPADCLAFLPAGPPRLIVLDAGHGGSDPGKQNFKLHLNEKDLTLDVVLRLRKLLEQRGYRVLLTRKDDSRLAADQRADLERRAAVANEAKADLFLSVHFNAVGDRDAPRVTGFETYVMTPQFLLSSADAKKDDLTDKAFPGNRQDLANAVLGYHLHRALLTGLRTPDRGYKRGRLRVLCFAECPAALLESAYLSNDAEAARLRTPEFRQQIAETIAAGIQSYADALAALRPAAK